MCLCIQAGAWNKVEGSKQVEVEEINRVVDTRVQQRILPIGRWNNRCFWWSSDNRDHSLAGEENTEAIVFRAIAESTRISVVGPLKYLIGIKIFWAHVLDLIASRVFAIGASLCSRTH